MPTRTGICSPQCYDTNEWLWLKVPYLLRVSRIRHGTIWLRDWHACFVSTPLSYLTTCSSFLLQHASLHLTNHRHIWLFYSLRSFAHIIGNVAWSKHEATVEGVWLYNLAFVLTQTGRWVGRVRNQAQRPQSPMAAAGDDACTSAAPAAHHLLVLERSLEKNHLWSKSFLCVNYRYSNPSAS
jgi:hypothetical protein